jgi:hypothetical protein
VVANSSTAAQILVSKEFYAAFVESRTDGQTISFANMLSILNVPCDPDVGQLGGYSEAEFSLGGTVTVTGIPNDGPYSVSSGQSWRQGYFVGGGLETMLAENLSAKLEYRYAQYDGGSFDVEETVSGGLLDGATVLGGASMSDPDVHSIRAALSWRFGNWGR